MNFTPKENRGKYPENRDLDVFAVREFIMNASHEYVTTHQVVCFAIIKRIYRRILAGYRFGSIK